MSRSVLKTLLYDLDGEKPGNIARGYAGADGIMDRLERAWAASSGTPRWKLFEESGSGGLASSVASAQILRFTWADIASTWAFENWKEPFDQLSYLVFLSKDSPTKGKLPEEWGEDSTKFPNNISMSKQEQMDLESVAANRAKVLVDMGAVSNLEIRNAYESGDFSTNITLLPQVTEQLEQQAQAQHDSTIQQNKLLTAQATQELQQSQEQESQSVTTQTENSSHYPPISEKEYADNLDLSFTTNLDVDDLLLLPATDEDIFTCAVAAICGNNFAQTIKKLRSHHEGVAQQKTQVFSSDDVITHFNAGLLSKEDALRSLGYQNAKSLIDNLNNEFISEIALNEDSKEGYPESLSAKIFADSNLQILEARIDAEDQELWIKAVADVAGSELKELLEYRKNVSDPSSWLRAVDDYYREQTT